MKMFLASILMFVFCLPAFAGFQGFSGSTNLGVFSKVHCSTGLTCTNGGSGKMTMVSSPSLASALTITGIEATAGILTIQTDDSDDSGDDWSLRTNTDDTFGIYNDISGSQVLKGFWTAGAADTSLSVQGAEAGVASLVLKADDSDDSGDDWQLSTTTGDLLTFSNDTSGSQAVKASMNTSGDLYGTGAGSLYGFLAKEVAATATTITADQCGSTFYNSGAVVINLPAGAAGIIGCRLTFITANAANFDVNPGNSDKILVLTDANGDAIRNATLGNSVTLQYGAANQWYEISAIGTWTDIN